MRRELQQRADQPVMPWEFQEVGSDWRDEDLVTCDVLVATIPKRETHDVLKCEPLYLCYRPYGGASPGAAS